MKTPAVLLVAMALSSGVLAAELDTFHLQDAAGWSCSKRIVVRPFALTGKFKSVRSQDEYMRQFVDRLATTMNGRSGIESISLEEGTSSGGADTVIEGHWKELNEGSRAARFWVGFGAGKARAEISMSAMTLPDGRPLFDLVHGRISAMGLSSDELKEDVAEVANDIAEALLEAHGRCTDSIRALSPPVQDVSAESVAVAIDSEPLGAEVYVDNAFVGTAPLPNFRLLPGDHTLEVRKSGYTSWIRKIRVSSGAPTQVKAVLVPEPPK